MEFKSPHAGHRSRLKKQVEQYGLDSLPDERILEYMLFFSIPYKDTLPISKALLERFGSLENVFKAPPEELKKIKNMTNDAATMLSTLPAIYGLHHGISDQRNDMVLATTS